MKDTLTIALSKGRILRETLPLLASAGIEPAEDIDTSRKLQIPTNQKDVSLLIIRATDVPTYVQYGAADVGVTGKDIIDEHGREGLYEPLDLRISRCRMMLAGPKGTDYKAFRRARVATKFVAATRDWFATQGQQVEIIKLYGSMELAPLVGLSDLIVDIVDTGNTLTANGLEPLAHIKDISSRLIVNKASMKMKRHAVHDLVSQLRKFVNDHE